MVAGGNSESCFQSIPWTMGRVHFYLYPFRSVVCRASCMKRVDLLLFPLLVY
jgi:hypothetical protein